MCSEANQPISIAAFPPTGGPTSAADVSRQVTSCYLLLPARKCERVLCVLRLAEGADTSHLDQVQHGYEEMAHFTANVERQRRALMSVDFLKGELASAAQLALHAELLTLAATLLSHQLMRRTKRKQLRSKGHRQEVTLKSSSRPERQPISSQASREALKIHPLLKALRPPLHPNKPRPLPRPLRPPLPLRYDVTR